MGREVNEWLDLNFTLGDSFSYPSQAEVAEINAHLSKLDQLTKKSLQNGPVHAGALNLSATISVPNALSVEVNTLSPLVRSKSTIEQQNVTMGSAA